MDLLANDVSKDNFWKINPNYKIIKNYKKLYDSDKSKSKIDSSKIMWSILLLCERSDSNPYRNTPFKDRKELIFEDYNDTDWVKYDNIIKYFINTELSLNERSLMNLDVKLQERESFLAETPYDLSNGKDLDVILKNTKDLYIFRESLQQSVNKDNESGKTKGGRVESAGEKKLI